MIFITSDDEAISSSKSCGTDLSILDEKIAEEYFRRSSSKIVSQDGSVAKLKVSKLPLSLPKGVEVPVFTKEEQLKVDELERDREELSDLEILKREMRKLIDRM